MAVPPKAKQGSSPTSAQAGQASAPGKSGARKSSDVLKELFADGAECITAPTGSFPFKDDSKSLLALFDNGRFLVSSEHRYDGRIMSFEVMARITQIWHLSRHRLIIIVQFVQTACV